MLKEIIRTLLLEDYRLNFEIGRLGNILAFLTSFSVCLCVTGFLFMIPGKHNLYYIACGLSLVYQIIFGGIKLNYRFLLFYLIILLNVMFLDIDPIFRSKMRALAFFFITLVCSPALNNDLARAYRERVFKYAMIMLSIMTILTFFCFFLGINMMKYNRLASDYAYENYMDVGGKFSGLFNHSMIMGPIAMIISLLFLNFYLNTSKKRWFLLFFMASMTCVFSASRAALLGIALGLIMMLQRAYNNIDLKNGAKRIIYVVTFAAIASLPIAEKAFSGLINKMETTQNSFGGYNSRERKYELRIGEFLESPIFGIGFASVDSRLGATYNLENGQIEPGTSHLAVLAQTGILGMICYISVLFGAFNVFRKSTSFKSGVCLCFFWAFFAHGWAEGWIFAPGGMICFLFWLSISQCYDLEFKESFV